jgi:CHAD domain-containing protein
MAPARRHYPAPRLNATMACDAAFRIVARRCLDDLSANREATCGGDPGALHRMRIALTRLRTSIVFFSPMVADTGGKRIRLELKWLNAELGLVRDLDVAIKRLATANQQQPQASDVTRSLNEKRAEGHRALARVLRSARYRRLFATTSRWIESGPWSARKAKQAVKQRARPIAAYSAGKLARWQKRLLKKSRKLLKMDDKKRHRVRLLNKKLSYSIESIEDLFLDGRFRKQQAALKPLRKAQRSLGQLNDDVKGHSLATPLQREGIHISLKFLGAKRERQLLRTAAAAYRKLTVLME